MDSGVFRFMLVGKTNLHSLKCLNSDQLKPDFIADFQRAMCLTAQGNRQCSE